MVQEGACGHKKAFSFQHHHGPVKGDHQKITWKNKHGHHEHDYVAEPHYKYAYGVMDHHTHDFHGQKEHGDGKFGRKHFQLNFHHNLKFSIRKIDFSMREETEKYGFLNHFRQKIFQLFNRDDN